LIVSKETVVSLRLIFSIKQLQYDESLNREETAVKQMYIV